MASKRQQIVKVSNTDQQDPEFTDTTQSAVKTPSKATKNNRRKDTDLMKQTESEADAFINSIERAPLRTLAREIHGHLMKESIVNYVKTIYIGYEFQGEMFAALYRNTNAIEVALPLPEDESGPLIMDASHLTWRTLPLMVHITRTSQLPEAFKIIDRSYTRLVSGSHTVHRTNEYFIARKKGRPLRGK